jgi:hypothetical protein
MGLTTHASVSGFFHEVVTEALQRKSLEVSPSAECYLVNLLGDYAHQVISDEPLSLKLAAASAPADRVRALKEVGDTSLYVTGFFSESLSRKLVDADYYINLGGAAYRELAHRFNASHGARAVYEELAANFPSFVEVLGEISRQVNFVGTDVVKLYEKWLETRSEWIEHRLRSLGMLSLGSDKDVH